jgi:hypothetical protein
MKLCECTDTFICTNIWKEDFRPVIRPSKEEISASGLIKKMRLERARRETNKQSMLCAEMVLVFFLLYPLQASLLFFFSLSPPFAAPGFGYKKKKKTEKK